MSHGQPTHRHSHQSTTHELHTHCGRLARSYCESVHNTCTAISVGHLQEHRKNVASTRRTPSVTPYVDVDVPDLSTDEINMDLPHIWIRRIDNSVHADAKTLQKGYTEGRYLMHFVFNNYHHIEICTSLDGADTADAYKKGLEFFESKGHLVDFIRIDNATSPHLRLMLQRCTFADKPLKLEYVNVGDHRRNKAEKGIQLMERAYLSTIASMDASFPSARRLAILPQLELTVIHLVGWSPNPTVSAWHGLHGHRYDFNAHPFTIAGCLVSRHVDKSKNLPKGHPKATLAWAVGPSPDHYRNFKILVAEGKHQYGLQNENQLDFHLPSHVKVHRLPYHTELAAAIKDLTTILRKTPPTEATGSATDSSASFSFSFASAASFSAADNAGNTCTSRRSESGCVL